MEKDAQKINERIELTIKILEVLTKDFNLPETIEFYKKLIKNDKVQQFNLEQIR